MSTTDLEESRRNLVNGVPYVCLTKEEKDGIRKSVRANLVIPEDVKDLNAYFNRLYYDEVAAAEKELNDAYYAEEENVALEFRRQMDELVPEGLEHLKDAVECEAYDREHSYGRSEVLSEARGVWSFVEELIKKHNETIEAK